MNDKCETDFVEYEIKRINNDSTLMTLPLQTQIIELAKIAALINNIRERVNS